MVHAGSPQNKTNSHLTIGIITRNGMAFLHRALDAVAKISPQSTDVILVDSASTDGSREALVEFARHRAHTRVFAIDGIMNAAVARNVILSHAAPGDVMLLDGDIAVNQAFIDAAQEEIRRDNAAAVYGQLPEVWHDADASAYANHPDRYQVTSRRLQHAFMGIVMLGAPVIETGARYDERFRRFEDIEFSLRVAERFRILSIPVAMGTHYTDSYHSRARLGDFIRQQYQRPVGHFMRKYWRHPSRIRSVMHHFSGYLWGLAMQVVLLLGLAVRSPLIAVLGAALLAGDAVRLGLQGRFEQFLPLRIIGGWQIITGLLLPNPDHVDYRIEELTR